MDFGKIFQSAEHAVYEVMIWILLLPKTLFRSLLKPRLMMEYVDEEWKKEKIEDRFDEYLSPVLLWLITVVAPLTLAVILGDQKASFDEKTVIRVTLYSMIIPFVYIARLESLNKRPVKKSTLKSVFYKHCYAITSGLLLTIICVVLAVFFYSLSLTSLVYVTAFVAIIALPIYEAFVFQSELNSELTDGEPKVTYKKGFLYALMPQIILLVMGFIALAIYGSSLPV